MNKEIEEAYGDFWEKVKPFVNEKGWCKIIPSEGTFPGRCGMVAGGYTMKVDEPNSNYMSWSAFRPKTLNHL